MIKDLEGMKNAQAGHCCCAASIEKSTITEFEKKSLIEAMKKKLNENT